MKYNKMHKNTFFREIECGLSREETAKLCFKTVNQVILWDRGAKIPPECKRLMRMNKQRELNHREEWKGFAMRGEYLIIPNGRGITSRQLLTALSLLEINSELEIHTTSKLIKLARSLSKLL